MINLSKVLKIAVPIVSGALGGLISVFQMKELKSEVTDEVTVNVLETIEATPTNTEEDMEIEEG